jgi:hypothetical protein
MESGVFSFCHLKIEVKMANTVTQLIEIRDGYLNALVQDSLNPSPSHTIDNITINATEWRKELLQRINDINNLITAFDPTEGHSVII